jgi:glucose-6-phosphate isomerase
MEIKNKKPDIRYLNEMRKVLYDKKWAKTAPNFEVYYMYRGIKKKDSLRYDITLLPPKMLGKEFVKTKGHEHSGNYGELYIVLKGKAFYLIQKYKNQKIEDVYIVRARRSEAVIIPSGYGHITINPSKKEELIEANWLVQKCQNIYKLFEKKQGACYYYTRRGWIKNKNYGKIPKLYFKKPLKSIPKDLSFLQG